MVNAHKQRVGSPHRVMRPLRLVPRASSFTQSVATRSFRFQQSEELEVANRNLQQENLALEDKVR